MTTVPVAVVRVFTDPEGRLGNPLGIVDGALVPPSDRHRVAPTHAGVGGRVIPAGSRTITI